jgi:hypothetical protein
MMLIKNKLYIVYGILIAIIIAEVSYYIGYEAQHTAKYISVDKQRATKAMQDNDVTEKQIDAIYEQLKNNRR